MKHQLRNSNSHKHQLKKLDGIQNHWLVANSFMMTFHIELIKWLTISIPNPYQVGSLRIWGLINLLPCLLSKWPFSVCCICIDTYICMFCLLLHTCFSSTERECLKYVEKNVFVGQCYVKSMSHLVPNFWISHPQQNRCKLNDNDHYSGLNVTMSYLFLFRLTGCGKTVWIIQ